MDTKEIFDNKPPAQAWGAAGDEDILRYDVSPLEEDFDIAKCIESAQNGCAAAQPVFSSTTSEMYLPPAELYSKVTREVQDAVALVEREYKGREALPLFWYVPEYLDAGITAEQAAADTPKCAEFKLHPIESRWDCCFATPKVATQARDFEHDAKHKRVLEEIFAMLARTR